MMAIMTMMTTMMMMVIYLTIYNKLTFFLKSSLSLFRCRQSKNTRTTDTAAAVSSSYTWYRVFNEDHNIYQ